MRLVLALAFYLLIIHTTVRLVIFAGTNFAKDAKIWVSEIFVVLVSW